MKNDERINEICHQEEKLVSIKEWLIVSFFLLSIVVILLVCRFIFVALNAAAYPAYNQDYEGNMLVKIIITLSTFVVLLVIGYFCHKRLSKKIRQLDEEKVSLI